MKIVGIITEYNPFHNGHRYHIEKARELTGADYVIAVMSGDFVQRGEPACIDKYVRTRAALLNEVDAVFELPLYYALGNAEHFAMGAISLLDKLGIVDSVCFGSECGDVNKLREIAMVLLEEPPAYQTVLKEKLKAGLSYPTASAAALISYFDDPALNETISQPNNILGIYYMKALMKRKSTIKPYTLLRCGSHYHEEMLGSKSDVGEAEILSSARSIRHSIASDLPLSEIADHIPAQVLQLLVQHQGQSFPITTDDFTAVLGYRLLNEMNKGFTDYIDVSENLSDRIVKEVGHYRSLSDFIDLLKTKDFTHARISRCLMHIMLGMQNETLADYIRSDYIAYARPLGFRNDSVTLLSAAKEHTSIPLLGKLADAKNILSPKAYAMLQEDIYASHVYQLAVAQKFHTTFSHEYQRRIIKI